MTVSRRTLLKTGAAAATASTLPLPFVHGAYAAGKLNAQYGRHISQTPAAGP